MNLDLKPFDARAGFEEQRSLFFDCFPEHMGKPTGTREHYCWKFDSFPASPRSYEYAAYAESGMIGYYAAIPYSYKIGDRVSMAGMVCDVMTSSKARGKGVFTKLGRYSLDKLRENGIDFTTGYPIRPEVVPGHLKVGWKIVQRMPTFIKPIKSRSILEAKNLGMLSPFADLAALLFRKATTLKKVPTDYKVEFNDLKGFLRVSDYSDFLERWIGSVPHALIKDYEFLRWRLGAPGTKYEIISVRSKAGKLLGVCICRKTELTQIPTLAVLDIMILPENYDTFRVVDYALVQLAQSTKAEIIATMMSIPWAKKYGLYRRGYLKSSYVFSLIINKLNPEFSDSEIFNPSNWHVMWIDSDDL
jgi:hypothetical protein